ncbi:hypothetical protein [Alkalibacter mobilis]|uniref:hypothetical protein n=1 Tax=Alkalibacter mobilis TaxID=2787712 RepID=UPI00189F6794|nr:hypothetical protein [Alkalibacter mobilis]MBF7096301.1 hypothetical protein [Alkalibacter mobilis]
MFYFLIILGGALTFGGFIKRNYEDKSDANYAMEYIQVEEEFKSEELNDLKTRLNELEKTVFTSLMVLENMKKNESRPEEINDEQIEVSGIKFEIEEDEKKLNDRSKTVEKLEKQSDILIAKKEMPDNIKSFLDYESKGLNIQEIANVMGIKKGEVLLLKNLSRHY